MAFRRFAQREVRVVVSGAEEVAEDAMRLAYRGSLESGYLVESASGLRFSPSYLNPGTRFLVAYCADEPIAAMTLVEDGPFGLPSDRAFVEELDGLRAAGDSLYEVGAVTIAPRWRRQMIQLITYLVGTGMRLNVDGGPHRRFVSSVEPRRARIFSETFSESFTAGPRPYLGAPAVLVATLSAAEWPDFLLDPDGLRTRKVVAERLFDPDPDWLFCDLDADDWRTALAPGLLGGCPEVENLRARLAVVDGLTRRTERPLTPRAMA